MNNSKDTEIFKGSYDSKAQRERILRFMKEHGSITTVQARHELYVMLPAARIYELRYRSGYNIESQWITAQNPGGRMHKIAQYLLHEAMKHEPSHRTV